MPKRETSATAEVSRRSGVVDATPFFATLAASIVALVLQWTNGMYRPLAVVLVFGAWALALAGLGTRATIPRDTTRLLFGAFFVVAFGWMFVEPPSGDLVLSSPLQMHAYRALVVVAFVLVALELTRAETRWFPLLVALHFAMGALVLSFAPKPKIDVWSIEMEAVRALLHGHNPYAMTFEDPYGGTSRYFPPGASIDGRLQFGFVYPPLALLLCVPGYLLGGDTRWSVLAAMTGAALLIGYARAGKRTKIAALALLFTPRTFFVMDRAWTDPFVVLLTAAIVFLALRRSRFLFVPIGLYVCLKQHMFIGIPALFMLLPRPIPKRLAFDLAWKGGLVAAIVTLPLVLVDVHAFVSSVLDIREMYRTDSLGLVALLHNVGIVSLSKWAGLIAIVPVVVLGWKRALRTAGGFAIFAAVTHFTLYLWSTHAFCNEYYNVIGALLCGVAVWDRA
jgi:hypothetical protein